MKKKTLFFVLVVVFSLFAAGCGSRVMATVDGKAITSAQLEEEVSQARKMLEQQGMTFQGAMAKEMLEMLRQQVLEQMIDEELLLREASRLGVEPTDKQVEEEIQNFRQQFGSEADYRKFLAANGFSEPKLKDYVKKNLAIGAVQKEAWKNVKEVTEKQARDFYEKNKDQFSTPEKYQIRQVLFPVAGGDQKASVEAKAAALNLLNRVKQGGEFPPLAENNPGGSGPASEIYVFSPGEADPELEKAVLSLKPGQIFPEPVRTTFGYHVVRLEEIVPAQTTPFEEAKSQIVVYLGEQARQNAFTEYLEGLRAKATIVNNLTKE